MTSAESQIMPFCCSSNANDGKVYVCIELDRCKLDSAELM